MSQFKIKILLKKPITWIICLVILILPTFINLIHPGFFPMQDDLQAFRLYEMNQCFIDLQIPCRWVPDMGYEYGYPQFNFYAPFVFYFGQLFHLVGMQFIDITKLLFILGFIFSAISMFILLRSLFGNLPAITGSLLYTYLPFKATEVYVRGSLSEFWALVFFPLLFWSSFKFVLTDEKKYGLWFALSVGLMFLTHILMSMLIFPVTMVWIITWVYFNKNRRIVVKVLCWGLLGIGLAAFFLLPLLAEKQYIHTETLLSGYFDYRQHFVPLKKILLDTKWGYGSSNLGQTETLNLSTGIIQWILGLTGCLGAIIFWKKDQKLSTVILIVGLMTILSLLMIHQKSSIIWSVLPILAWLQFPWRFLAISGFLLSILVAVAIFYLQKWPRLMTGVCVCSILLAIVLSWNFYQPKSWLNITDEDKFSGESWQKQLTISIFDYLPIFAKLPPNHIAPDRPETLSGQAQFSDYKKRSDYQEGNILVTSAATLRLPFFDFPGMKVQATTFQGLSIGSAKEVNIVHWSNDCQKEEYCLGLITFQLPPGKYHLSARLEDTPIRTLGNLISLASLLILIYLAFLPKKLWQLSK